MIRKAIYSFWSSPQDTKFCGFLNLHSLLCTLALSVEQTKKQFKDVELITNDYGKELLKDIRFTSVRTDLNALDNNIDPNYWAYAKIVPYSLQTEPFIHIDNDVIIWDVIPEYKLMANLLFQNKEYLNEVDRYLKAMKEVEYNIPDIIKNNIPEDTYNCGVVGANDLETIKQWKNIVDEYLFKINNKEINIDKYLQNHLFEQYFISSIIKDKNIAVDSLLTGDILECANKGFKMTHLWGKYKENTEAQLRIKNRLFKDYPVYVEIFSKLQ